MCNPPRGRARLPTRTPWEDDDEESPDARLLEDSSSVLGVSDSSPLSWRYVCVTGMSSIEMCRPALVLDSGASQEGDLDLAAASQVDAALVSQDGEPTVEESVAMDGNELIDDLLPPMWLETLTEALVMPLPMLPLDKMLLPLDKLLLPAEGGNELTTG